MKLLMALMVVLGTGAPRAQAWLEVEPIEERLPFFDARLIYPNTDGATGGEFCTAVTSALPLPCPEPVNVQPVRTVYPLEDGSVDAVVWFDAERFAPKGHRFRARLLPQSGGAALVEAWSGPLTAGQQMVRLGTHAGLVGQPFWLEIALMKGNQVAGQTKVPVEVRRMEGKGGEIPLRHAPGQRGVPGTPMRLGVPLPRGFFDARRQTLALVDSAGKTHPLHWELRRNWARHGTAQWVFVTYLAPVGAGPLRLRVVEGRPPQPPVALGATLSAGEVAKMARKLSGAAGLVDEAWLQGGFVEHVRGASYGGWTQDKVITPGERYTVPAEVQWVVESAGETMLGLRCESWFQRAETREKFCRFVARLRLYPGSPVVDFEYTWIFTGDGNRDRIRNMGWRFPVEALEPAGFLLGGPEPVPGEALVQVDADACNLWAAGKAVRHAVRAPGVAVGRWQGKCVAMGVRDFWENFPSELSLSAEGVTFHLWPAHGEPRTHPVTMENAYRLWFAHEGEALSFALPQEMAEPPLYGAISGVEPAFARGMPESVNAQGVAKTTQIRFIVGEAVEPLAAALASWNDRSADPFADPEWVAQSGVYPGLSAAGAYPWPGFEENYRRVALWPAQVAESFSVYGKWIYGDIPMVADPDSGKVGLYRAYDKAHWGWPYSWVPYIRSGEPRYRKLAEAGTRMMADTAYCHYVSPELEAEFAALPPRHIWAAYPPFRARGWNNEGLIPWAGGYWGPTSRMYCDRVDFLFDHWHLTGYAPAREVALDWMAQTKREEPGRFGRGPILSAGNRTRWTDNLLRQYLLAYEETADPWFIMGAHAIAKMHLWMETHDGWKGHPWQGGATDFVRYTHDPAYSAFYLRFARHWLEPSAINTVWGDVAPLIQPAVPAYQLSGDPWFLRRALFYVEALDEMIRTAPEPAAHAGLPSTGGTNEAGLYYGWYLRWAPEVPGVLAALGQRPRAIPNGYYVRTTPKPDAQGRVLPEIRLRLPAEPEAARVVFNIPALGVGAPPVVARISGPDGGTHEVPLAAGLTPVPLPGAVPHAEYRVELVSAKGGFELRLPIAPEGVAEVYLAPEGGVLPPARGYAEFWFPGKGGEVAKVELKPHSRHPVRRVSLYDAEGARLANEERLNRELPKAGEAVAFSLERAGFAGVKVYGQSPRTTLPAAWHAVSQEKWFDPQARITPVDGGENGRHTK